MKCNVNDGSDNLVLSFTYDYMGRRVKKVTYYNGDVNEMTRFVYDGQQVIAEYDYNDTTAQYELARKFIHGDGIDQPICMNNLKIGSTYYYHYDALGNVAALSDENADVVETYDYDAFGETTIRDDQGSVMAESSVDNPYMFTGRRFDDESGLYYYRYRYYSPEIGRFLQTDPLGYYDGMNLYAYVGNNPINWIDSFGLNRGFNWNKNPLTDFYHFIQAGLWTIEGILSTIVSGTAGILNDIGKVQTLPPEITIPPIPINGSMTPELHIPLEFLTTAGGLISNCDEWLQNHTEGSFYNARQHLLDSGFATLSQP